MRVDEVQGDSGTAPHPSWHDGPLTEFEALLLRQAGQPRLQDGHRIGQSFGHVVFEMSQT